MSLSSLRKLLFPCILLIAALVLRDFVSHVDSAYQPILDWLPYITLGLAAVLCVYYNRSRSFTVSVYLLIVYFLVQSELQIALSVPRAYIVYSLISILLPLTIFILILLPERGLKNRYGVLLVAIPPVEYLITISLFYLFPESTLLSIVNNWLPANPFDQYVLSINASICFVCAILASLLKLVRQGNNYYAAIVTVLLSTFITLTYFYLQKISLVMFGIAGIIIIIDLLQSSYDMAYRDELTGLLGRRALNEHLKGLSKKYVIAMMDVDYFKKFNDTYGHDVGDEVLKMVGQRIDAVKGGGTAYRYGGEEFCIVFPNKSVNVCKPFLEAVREGVADYHMILRDSQHRPKSMKTAEERRGRRAGKRQERTVSVTISIGASEPDSKRNKPDQVLKAADSALYKAKKKGRNCLVI